MGALGWGLCQTKQEPQARWEVGGTPCPRPGPSGSVMRHKSSQSSLQAVMPAATVYPGGERGYHEPQGEVGDRVQDRCQTRTCHGVGTVLLPWARHVTTPVEPGPPGDP